jgi:hypothetical protein
MRRLALFAASLLAFALPARAQVARFKDKTPLEMLRHNLDKGGRVVDGDLLITLHNRESERALHETSLELGCKVKRRLGERALYLVACGSKDQVAQKIGAFEKVRGVRWIDAGYAEEMEAAPDDLQAEQWYHQNTGAEVDGVRGIAGADLGSLAAWDISTGSETRSLMIIDVGIFREHEDLVDQMWVNTDEDCGNGVDDDANGYVDDCRGFDFGNDDNDPDPRTLPDGVEGDDCLKWHATMIAGLAAAHGNNGKGMSGINWNVKLMNVKKHRDASCESTTNRSTEAAAYAIDNGGDALAMAFSTSSYSATFEMVLQEAERANIVIFTSGGNGNRDNDTLERYPSQYAVSNKVVIGNSDNLDRLYAGANYGANTLDIAAPGTFVMSTSIEAANAYGFGTGASYCAGMGAGAATLLWSAFPDLSGTEVTKAIKDGAKRVADLDCANTVRCVRLGARLDLFGMMAQGSELRPPDLSISEPMIADADGDGIIEKGERIELRIAVTNTGRGGAFALNGHFAVDFGIESDIPLGTVGLGGMSDPGAMQPFVFEIEPTCTEDHRLPVRVAVSDPFEHVWNAEWIFDVKCAAPVDPTMPVDPVEPNMPVDPVDPDPKDSEASSCACARPQDGGARFVLAVFLIAGLIYRRRS